MWTFLGLLCVGLGTAYLGWKWNPKPQVLPPPDKACQRNTVECV